MTLAENHFRVIVLPDSAERKNLLKQKKDEYLSRIPSDEPVEDHIDLATRVQLIDQLLKNGVVDPMTVVRELLETCADFHTRHIRNAVAVVRDYAETGGKNLVQGVPNPK